MNLISDFRVTLFDLFPARSTNRSPSKPPWRPQGRQRQAHFLEEIEFRRYDFALTSALNARLGHGAAGKPAGGPGRLEVEHAGQPVDVEDFAGKIEAGTPPALHRFEVDLLEPHAPAGDKFFLEQALAGHGELPTAELVGERSQVIVRHGSPESRRLHARGGRQPLPEPLRHTE